MPIFEYRRGWMSVDGRVNKSARVVMLDFFREFTEAPSLLQDDQGWIRQLYKPYKYPKS